MDETPSDFIDFNAFRDLTAQSERELLQRQLSELETATGSANQLLLKAANDAGRQQAADVSVAGGATNTSLSSVGSYGDYLKAKQNVQNLRAMMALNGGGASGDVRSSVAAEDGFGSSADSVLQRLNATEAYKGKQLDESMAGANRNSAELKAYADRQAAERAAREASDKAAVEGFNASVLSKMQQEWAKLDASAGEHKWFQPWNNNYMLYREGVNPFDPNRQYHPEERMSYRGLMSPQDAARLTQMAQTQGLNKEAERFNTNATYEFGKRTKGGY